MENLKYLKEMKDALVRLRRVTDIRAEVALERQISKTVEGQISRICNRLTENLAALKILVSQEEIIKEIESTVTEIVTFYYSKILPQTSETKNREMKEFIDPKVEELLSLVGILEREESYFKFYIRHKKEEFFKASKDLFHFMGFEKIVIRDINPEDEEGEEKKSFNLFFNEIGSAQYLNRNLDYFVEVENGSKEDILFFGSNEDPEEGRLANQIDRMHSLRGGPRRVSSGFANISFENRTFFEAFPKETESLRFNEGPYIDVMSTNNVTAFGGYEVVLMFSFDVMRHRSRNRNMKIVSVANLDPYYGLVSVIYKKTPDTRVDNQRIITRILHNPESFPDSHSNRDDGSYVFEIERQEKPLNFFGRVVTMEDIANEFNDIENSFDDLLEMGTRKRENLVSEMSLQEIKPGHIPTLSTTGISNGRYVDEVLRKVAGKEFGFDHLVCTKIIKRTLTEEIEDRTPAGDRIVKHIEKNANVIISRTLTPQGEFIEQFNNDVNKEVEEEEV